MMECTVIYGGDPVKGLLLAISGGRVDCDIPGVGPVVVPVSHLVSAWYAAPH